MEWELSKKRHNYEQAKPNSISEGSIVVTIYKPSNIKDLSAFRNLSISLLIIGVAILFASLPLGIAFLRNEVLVINLLADCFLELEKTELALEVLQKGPVRSRKMANEQLKLFHYLLGQTYLKLGNKKKALSHFQKIYVDDRNFKDVEKLIEELESQE